MSQEKNEKPTARRLDKARKQGQFPVSRDLLAGSHFMAALVVFDWTARTWLTNTSIRFETILGEAFAGDLTPARFNNLWMHQVVPGLVPLGGVALGLFFAMMALQLGFTQFVIGTGRLKPAWSRLNPATKLKEIASNGPMSALKAIALVIFGVSVVFWLVREHFFEALALLRMTPAAAFETGVTLIRTFAGKAAGFLLVIGAIDWIWQKQKFNKSMRMSKQEVKEEHKESDGNPETKGRIRRLQRDLSRRKMMQEVPKATAVIVNPTHYAVAIQYHMESASAPKVVAKGKNYLAARIRLRATEAGVPIVENAPLAQALYKAADVGQEIPPHLYRAVAEILAYIYKLMNGRLPGA